VIRHDEGDPSELGINGQDEADGVGYGQMDHVGPESPDLKKQERPGKGKLIIRIKREGDGRNPEDADARKLGRAAGKRPDGDLGLTPLKGPDQLEQGFRRPVEIPDEHAGVEGDAQTFGERRAPLVFRTAVFRPVKLFFFT